MTDNLINTDMIQLLQDLSFVAKLPTDKVLNWTLRTYDDPNYLYDKLKRTLLTKFYESRKITINKLNEITNTTTNYLIKYSSSSFFDVILEHFLLFKEGLVKLRDVYSKDEETSGELDNLMITIDSKLYPYYMQISSIEKHNNRSLQCLLWENRLKDKEEALKRMEYYFRITKEELNKFEKLLEDRRSEAINVFERLGMRTKDLEISVIDKVGTMDNNGDIVKEQGGQVDVNGILQMILLSSSLADEKTEKIEKLEE